MLRKIPALRLMSASLATLFLIQSALSQAAPSIQFFMPDGSLPSREVRFTLAMDNAACVPLLHSILLVTDFYRLIL